MKRRLCVAIAGALAAIAAPLALAPAAAQAQAQRDWSATVVATPEGFRMGNPAAPVQVVEFVSLTCPHCRSFAEAGAPSLVRNYVRSGRVSFEIRAFPLDVIAATAAQLNRCAPPASYFALNDAILSAQEGIFARVEALTPEQVSEIEALAPAEFRLRIAALTGVDALAAEHGIPAAQVRTCLADEAGASRIEQIKAAAEQLGVHGTPSFLVNGRLAANVHDWAALEPLLAGR